MNERTVYRGRLISLYKRRARLPNGYVSTLEIIKHPGAVLIIPFITEDKIILLRQYRPVINTYMYELPAGTLKKNEAGIACARREIVEETGFSAKKLTRLGCIYPVPGYSTEKITIYEAKGLIKKEGNADKDEVIECFTVTKSKVKRLFKEGKLIDAKTICAFSLCGWL